MSLLKEVSINSSIYGISLSLGGGIEVQIFEADVIFSSRLVPNPIYSAS